MQIVKTRKHLIYSANQGSPSHACLGLCQKVWWEDDLPTRVAAQIKLTCPQCGGTLTSKIPEGHYEVVTKGTGELEKSGAKIANIGLNLGK